MRKEQILDFINRYYLGGKIESAAWEFSGNELTTKFRSADKSFMGILNKKNFGFDDNCEIGILTTSKLIRMLNILESDFEFNLTKHSNADGEDKITSINLVNGKARLNYMLADLTVIPKAKGLKQEPDYDLTIDITNEFIDLFIKGKAALPDTKSFTVVKNNKTDEYEIVIGYSATNSDSIYIPVEVKELDNNTLDRPISFSSEYFKEILSANKGSKEFTFTISGQGISHIHVVDDEYSIDYYLAEVQTDI